MPRESAGSSRVAQAESSGLPPSCRQLAQSTSDGEELLKALAADPSAVSYARLGQFYLEGGEGECARFTLENALTKDAGLWKARYGLGLALLQQGDASRAVEELRLVLQQAPQDSMAHNALGLGLETLGDYGSSEREFKTALEIDPQFDMAYFNLAHVLGAQGNYPAVIFYLKKAVALAPQQPAYRFALGTAYLASGDFDEAIHCLNELLAISPDTTDTYFQIGNAYLKSGNTQLAVKSYRQALRVDPQNGLARLGEARALLTAGSDAEAVPVLREYTARQTGDFQGYYLLGHAYRNLNEFREAQEALEHAVRIKPDDYNVRYELGLVLEHLGSLDAAREQLRSASRLNPDEAQAHYELSKLLRSVNESEGARQEFQTFLKLEARDRDKARVPALHAQAIAAMKQGDATRAIGVYREALKLDSSDAQLLYDFAFALGAAGDAPEQELHLHQALKLDPHLVGAHCQLGLLYMNGGKTREAEGQFRTALDIDPQCTDAQVDLGILFAREEKEAEAETLFRQAIENNSQSATAHANLGLLLARQGHDLEAERELKEANRLSSEDVDILPLLADLQSRLGHPIDSTCTLTRLTDLEPLSAQAHTELGIALAALYSYEVALEEFSRAVRLGPNPASARIYKARTLYDLGRISEARQELQAFCASSPKEAAAWYLFALIERQAKNIALSTKYLEDVVRLEPKNADAEFLLGQNWFELGEREKAIGHWQAALKSSPDQWRSLYSLTQVYRSSRNPNLPKYQARLQELERRHDAKGRVGLLSHLAEESATARDWPTVLSGYQEALRECGSCDSAPELHQALGMTYCQTGRLADGERQLRIAVQMRPLGTISSQILERIEAVGQGTPKEWLRLCPGVSVEGDGANRFPMRLDK
jgi:tetratricopeptide (TPR) repeat protein